MYTDKNFRTKKELKAAVDAYNAAVACNAAGVGAVLSNDAQKYFSIARPVTYHQPGPFGGDVPKDGTFCCEGPHYHEPHRWYATCTAKDGVIVKVR